MTAYFFLFFFAFPAVSFADDKLSPFLGAPGFGKQRLFDDQRYPNVVVTMTGTVLAVWGNSGVVVRRSEDGGRTWGLPIPVARTGHDHFLAAPLRRHLLSGCHSA